MSKIQTKINFLEKKKTSTRLQEKLKKNEIKQNKLKSETQETEKKSNNKENELKVKLLCRKNPTVLIYRSPIKSVQAKEILKDGKVPEIMGSPKRNVKSIRAEDELNINNSKGPNTTEQESNISRSPLKEKPVGSATPTKDRRYFNLRKSPQKKENTNSLFDVSQESNDSCTRLSPLKRGSPGKNGLRGEESSPPKQKCMQEETPSQLLTKLALESPQRKQENKSRKELFPKGEFDEACKALHSSAPVKLPGREDKLEFIKGFLAKHLEDQSSGTLYISGPPGTGKTASINVAISEPKIADQYKVICLNCTSLTSCGSIYSRIVGELKLKVLGHSEKAALTAIEKHLESNKRKMILIVLDELDQLCSTKQSVLYSVFEWPARKNARLVLIGIANALDLTDRVLPRLQAHLALQPTVLHFPSYTRQQIIDIIADRLTQAGVEAVFSGPTLQLLAGKVAAVNGDVRRALDIARRVVEVAENRTTLQPLSNDGSRRQTVALQEVMAVINDVYSTAQSLDCSESDSFPLQQKLLICSLLLMRQTSKTKDITVGKLHEVYKKVCGRRNLSALDISEFISLMPLVEARGLLRLTGKNHNRQSKVVLQWDEGEVKNALQDKQLLAAVLLDKGIV